MNKGIKKILVLTLTLLMTFININIVKAASATISVSTSTSKVVVGNTFNVTIKISSSTGLGSWEFTPSYDSSMLSKISGETPIVEVADNGNTKSKSYTYKFKALKTGNATIGVKSYGAYAWNMSKLSVSASSKSVSIITQAQLEASYSKNNNLKSLSVDGLKLSPTFNKNTTSYTVDAGSNTNSIKISASVEDSKSSVKGTGTHEVSEGENKFNITVTAQNGSTKTYTIIVNVVDPNPINVTIDDNEYTVIKRESLLECPDGYENKKIKINDQEIPAFYNELNDFTLVGLKDKDSNVVLFLYDTTNNTYSKYDEVILQELKIYPLKIDKEFDSMYEKSQTTINNVTFDSLKINNSEYSIINAKNMLTGKSEYYLYDSITNSIIRYTDENNKILTEKLDKQKKLIVILGVETILIIFILICVLIGNIRKKKRYNIEIEKLKEIVKNKTNGEKKKKGKKKEVDQNEEA